MLKVSKLMVVGVLAVFLLVGCKPDYPNCKKDEHCQDAEFCVNNLCQQCRDNGDCPAGMACSAGGCQEVDDYCATNADCSEGQICRDNTCGPCLSASDCSDGQVCADGICTVAECQSDDECPAGLNCVNYKCEVDENANSQLGEGDCSLEPLYFEFDSSELDDENRDALENNFVCLQERGGIVRLEGHCDSLGTTEYNMALGERRARVVANLLKRMGVEGEQIRVTSKGEEEATGSSEAARAKDRRVDFE